MLQKLEYKIGRYAIRNLMMFVVLGMAFVFISGILMPVNLANLFAFDRAAIMQGEIWRVITFIFIPPASGMFFILLALYFFWLLGSALEREWGAFRFNAFYLCGMVGTIIAGFITGFATNFYVNLSLLLAFAILYPNFQVMLFFVIPIKIKWLAYINAAYLLYMFIFNSWQGRVVLLVSVLNIILFFRNDFLNTIKREYQKAKWKRRYRR